MKFSPFSALLFTQQAVALIGHGIQMYNPSCAHACRGVIASAPLECSDHGHGGGGHHGGGATTPECRAFDTPFLTTLAHCIETECAPFGVETWRLEKYWADKATGDVTVLPQWTYKEALEHIEETPELELEDEQTLNFTAIVSHDTWLSQKNSYEQFEYQESAYARYGLVLLIVGFATPILFTLLRWLPYGTGVAEKLKPYLNKSIVGTYNVRPLPNLLGNAPTVGQAYFIAFFFVLNLLVSCLDYQAVQPNTIFASTYQEILGYISARTGVLAFALAPLVILFATRNNFLLWVTDWSHSTYILLHRWIARIFTIQVVVHSIAELVLYKDMGELEVEQVEPYWIWGIVATLACCIMVVISVLYFRQKSYEIFLIIHIIMAVFVLVGSWYHVELLFKRKWGYEFWLYAACAVWFFDRVLRVVRIAKLGFLRSKVTEVSDDIVRVDIEGVRWGNVAGHHAYIYFPLLDRLRPWENHPFSIVPTAMLRDQVSSPTDSSSESGDPEKGGMRTTAARVSVQSPTSTAGVSFFIRKSTGITKLLKQDSTALTLLEGPYPNNSPGPVLMCDRLVLVGGGIGITALLPFIRRHDNVKLYWSVKQASDGLVRSLDPALAGLQEKEVKVGARLDVDGILAQEAQSGWEKIGVVVCGPGGLCDHVRDSVTKAGRKGDGKTTFELEVDAYSW